MPSFDIIRQAAPSESFRVKAVMGQYDLQQSNVVERFSGNISLPEKWNIGLIVGKSGTGKTTIAKELFPDCIVSSYEWKHDNILDDMPGGGKHKRYNKNSDSGWVQFPSIVDEAFQRTVEWREDAMRNSACYFRKTRYVCI